jgi:hypothetical protein
MGRPQFRDSNANLCLRDRNLFEWAASHMYRRDQISGARNEPALISRGRYLGKFRLNGYLFEAYEQEADNGVREFRLISSPSVNPAREAAFIRYMVYEGLIERMWPEMSRQIEEQANWAFEG